MLMLLCLALLLFILSFNGRNVNVLYSEEERRQQQTIVTKDNNKNNKKRMQTNDDMSKITITNRITKIEAKNQIEEEKDKIWRIQVAVNQSSGQIRHMFDVQKSLLQQQRRQRQQQPSSKYDDSSTTNNDHHDDIIINPRHELPPLKRSIYHQTRFEQRKGTLSKHFSHDQLFVSTLGLDAVNILNDRYGSL